ncbi:hypothetical protein jhhlp_003229 [Lomentospora prolificans]|uniref:Uncharacterized protein n=1 Tax=Lomentospora prolificans TaxID=41688 RepID=A0A2N3NGA7_9PEZI|nr:hypothetical protein jhhlp_003229 [Lomentospora prolificans]
MSDNTDDRDAPWFPENKFDWRLDVVTLLAVIGEASMAEHSQAITASALLQEPNVVDRDLRSQFKSGGETNEPHAPQAFLNASRPKRLPETKAIVTGVYSGVTLDSISFFANILIPLDLPPYAFKVIEIKHVHPSRQNSSNSKSSSGPSDGPMSFLQSIFKRNTLKAEAAEDVERSGNNPPKSAAAAESASVHSDDDDDPARGGMRRRNTLKEIMVEKGKKAANVIVAGGQNKRPAVPAQLFSPLHTLTLLSFLVSLSIVAGAIYWRDGTAILAISLISLASSIVGYASWWQPQLMSTQGAENRKLPDGDILIRTREGAFIYVKCDESVARELFSGTEECKYHVGSRSHDALMAAGTIILMLSVVLLGNCKWNSQIFIGASYIVLNGFYWGIGMLPKRWSWDLGRYEITDVTPADAKRAHEQYDARAMKPTRSHTRALSRIGTKFGGSKQSTGIATDADTIATVDGENDPGETVAKAAASPNPDSPEARACFTRTLWYAIRETRSADWAKRTAAAPRTKVWDMWLEQAHLEAQKQNRSWAAVTAKDEMMKSLG